MNKLTKRTVVAGVLLATSAVSCSSPPGRSAENEKKPSIIYIMADDLGWGDVGFNGQEKIRTPNIDRLAAEGIIFTRHYAGSPVCGPSRSVLLTGLHSGHAPIRENPAWAASGIPVDLKPQDVTVAEELKRAGYVTGAVGKWALDETFTTGHPNDQGFDYFYGFRTHTEAHSYYPPYIWRNKEMVVLQGNDPETKKGKYSHDLFAEEALQFIRQNKDTSFFLYLAFTIPHNEITVPEESKAPYLNLGWPERPMQAGHYKHDPEGNTTYAGMISRMDRDVGRVLDLLRELAIDENTLVIFTSDHGPGFDRGFFNSNGPFRGGKLSLYEGGLRVPFAARWPGHIAAGTLTDHPVAFWDFLPTACDIAGISPSITTDGISYLPILTDREPTPHTYFYWEVNENAGPGQAIVKGDWKGIQMYEKPFQLYNLSQDVAEENNLADQYPDIVEEMLQLMKASRTEHPEFPLTKRSADYSYTAAKIEELRKMLN